MSIGELINYLMTPVTQVALIMGLAEMVKKIWGNTRYIPLIDLALGLANGRIVS